MPSGPPGEQARPSGAAAQPFPRPFGGRYTLLQHLATGGMADVFLARQVGGAGFVRECVIKRILPHLAGDAQFVDMFLDEARLCARLNHPNVALVYDHGKVGDDYFMAMEYVDGVDLEQVLDEAYRRGEKRLPFPIAARIVAGVAEGLAHAHNALDEHGRPLGLVHRDVTPSNVVISFEGVPKLLDFGVALAASRQSKTEVGVIKGKAAYMSPEQVQGEPLDARSDLFALGAILYELTTGDKPFPGDNAAQLGVKILHDEPTPPTLLAGDFPEELEAIILSALAKRPAERTPSARAMQMQLERFLVNARTPVTSYDVAHYLARRFERKRITGHAVPAAATGDVSGQSGQSGQSGGGSASMSEQPESTPNSQGTPSLPPLMGSAPLVGDLGSSGSPPTRRAMGGGGGPWMAGVIVGLVVAVGAGLLYLRSREQQREAASMEAPAGVGSPTAAPPPPATPAPAPVPAVAQPAPAQAAPPAAAAPAGAPSTAPDLKGTAPAGASKPAAGAGSPGTSPPAAAAAPSPSAPPKVTALPPRPAAAPKPTTTAPKPHKPTPNRGHGGGHALPTLPKLPAGVE